MSELVEKAKELAYRAHSGQVDKAGQPYVEHLARVAAAVVGDDEAEAVAWLHDLIEDATAFAGELDEFPASVRRAVIALTRYPADTPKEYYANIRSRSIALRVKLADVADNADESRLSMLDNRTADRLRKKYRKAIAALTA